MNQLVDVELAFTAFVRRSGGKVVSDIIGLSPNHPNADFYWPDSVVVAELKRLTQDKREDDVLQTKVQALFDKWMNEGTIPTFYGEQVRIDSKTLPETCQRELLEIYKAPIHRRVLKANKQIKATANRFRLSQYFGLLILVNDGNYALEAHAVLYMIWRSLGRSFQHINNVVYLTVNMPATSPKTVKPTLVWAQISRDHLPSIDQTFLDGLWTTWRSYLEELVGVPIDVIHLNDMSDMRPLRYIKA